MIRLLLLTVIPLILPFAVWYIWKVFAERPRIDPASGEQTPPDIKKAPRIKLVATGVVLMLLTLGGFLLFHDKTADKPYAPINVDEAEKKLDRGIAPDRPVTPR